MASVAGALRYKKYGEALDALLEIWRTTHDPKIAGTIAQISEHASGNTEDALEEAAECEDFHESWMTIAQKSTWSSSDLVPLLETLVKEASLPQMVERYEWIIDRAGDDPRLSKGLVDILENRFEQGSIGAAEELGFFERLIQKVASMRDETAQHRLFNLGFSTHPWAPIAAAGASAAQALLRARPPTAVDPRFFESIDGELPIRKPPKKEYKPPTDPIERRAWDLLQRIYEDPDDDEARLVYADALHEMNNPRGEAIAIGFKVAAGRARVTDRRRLQELIDRHGREWLGGARRVLDVDRDIEFEKGFPVLLRTRWHGQWREAIVDARELSTVRIVDTTSAYADFRETLSAPIMRHVRSLRIGASERLEPHLPIFERIVQLVVCTSMLISDDFAKIRAAFPNVKDFEISWSDDRAWDTRVMRPSNPATFVKLVGEGCSPLISSLTFRMHERMPEFLSNAFEALPHAKKNIERLSISAGAEGFVLNRQEGGWLLKVEARDDDAFDPARVRLFFQSLPETLPIVNRASVEIPPAVAAKKKKKKK